MRRDLRRLFDPKSIALFGGGWAENVIAQLQKSGYVGEIWPVHPKREVIGGITCFRSLGDLPSPPDAAFVGVNREASIEVIGELSRMGAGGATCFASGFRESDGEGSGGGLLQDRLVAAAGDMPILGPNCYGFLNYLDNVTLWPDQHGGLACTRGVGIIAQSSNIAINMTMQKRGLPIACMIAAGNQAQTGIADIGEALLLDDRISALGLYLEGFGDIKALERLAQFARKAGKPIVALKIGKSQKAKIATFTHTASLAGSADASSALLMRLGIVEVGSIAVFLETLKLMDCIGPIAGNAVCSISCSGGEASLMADLAPSSIDFRDFGDKQSGVLKADLGPLVTIANPLDYHTYIWGDVDKMTNMFAAAMQDSFDLCVCVLDLPREDICDTASFECAVEAIIAAHALTGVAVGVLSTLPENMPEHRIRRFHDAGIVCLNGMEAGLAAIDAAIRWQKFGKSATEPVLLASPLINNSIVTLDEKCSKEALAEFGVSFPRSVVAEDADKISDSVSDLTFPVVLKGLGIAHKSEVGAVVLNISSVEALRNAAEAISEAHGFLIEEMVADGVAEILVGVTRDETGLMMLTIGSGGVTAELMADTVSMLLPAGDGEIRDALAGLKTGRLLKGFRGNPAASIAAVVEQIQAIAGFATANCDLLLELDVNPLIACVDRCVAVDALVRLQGKED